jgi:Nucleotidyl transferase AbiEii toxin, Type IV TA system
VREQLLEGFLLRLARTRDADAYALRGGMLVRQWGPAAHRPVRDVDLVCALPPSPRDVRQRLHEVLSHQLSDGVEFDADRFRVDAIPIGFKLFAAGEVDGRPAEIGVDLAFAVDAWPAALQRPFHGARGIAMLGMCAHEMVIATKLAVTTELGARAWRPKDLADIWLALRRFASSSMTSLGEALEHRAGTVQDAVAILSAPWWLEMPAAMRWARHVAARPFVPCELAVAIAEIRSALAPLASMP